MQDTKLIRAMTDAVVPLEVVDREVLTQLKAQNPIYVSPRQLRSSHGVLISENFARCQGVSFLDDGREVGALAHNYSTHDPYYTLTGKWAGSEHHLEDPRSVFDDLTRVLAVHVYHIHRYEWPESWIEGALANLGVKRVVHIPIKPKESGRVFWRHIAQDVRDGSVYIFPTDFDIGVKYHPNSAR